MVNFTLKSLMVGVILISKNVCASSVSFPGLYGDLDGGDIRIASHVEEEGLLGSVFLDKSDIFLELGTPSRVILIENGMEALAQSPESSNWCTLKNFTILEATQDVMRVNVPGLASLSETDHGVPCKITVDGRDICVEIVLAAYNQKFRIQKGLNVLKVPFLRAYSHFSGDILLTNDSAFVFGETELIGTVSRDQSDVLLEFGNPKRVIFMQKSEFFEGFYNMRNVNLVEASSSDMRIRVADVALLSQTDHGVPCKITVDGRDICVEIVLAEYNQTFRIPYGEALFR